MPNQANPGGGRAVNTHQLSTRTVGGGILAIVLLLFALFNTQKVRVHWIFATTTAPLIVVIAGCAVVGMIAGWLLSRRRAARQTAG